MRALIASLFACLVAVSASAQTIESQTNVNVLGYQNHDVRLVDADGNPATEEWLAVPKAPGGAFQVVAIASSGAACFGAWFVPTSGFPAAEVVIGRRGTRDVLLVREYLFVSPGPTLRVVGLTRPPC